MVEKMQRIFFCVNLAIENELENVAGRVGRLRGGEGLVARLRMCVGVFSKEKKERKKSPFVFTSSPSTSNY